MNLPGAVEPTWIRVGLQEPTCQQAPSPGTGDRLEPCVVLGLAEQDLQALFAEQTDGRIVSGYAVAARDRDGTPVLELRWALAEHGVPEAQQRVLWRVRMPFGEALGGIGGWTLPDDDPDNAIVLVLFVPDTARVPVSGRLSAQWCQEHVADDFWLIPATIADAAGQILTKESLDRLGLDAVDSCTEDQDDYTLVAGHGGPVEAAPEKLRAAAQRLQDKLAGHDEASASAGPQWTTFGQDEPLGAAVRPEGGSRAVLSALGEAGLLPDRISPLEWLREVIAMQQLDAAAVGWERWAPGRPWPTVFIPQDVPHIRALTHFPGAMLLRDLLASRTGQTPEVVDAMFGPVALSHLALAAATAFVAADALPMQVPSGAPDPDRDPPMWPARSTTVLFDRNVRLRADQIRWSRATLSATMIAADINEELARMGVPLPESSFRPAMNRINAGMADLVGGVTLLSGPGVQPGHLVWHIATQLDASELVGEEVLGRGYRGVTYGRYGCSLLAPVIDHLAERVVAAEKDAPQVASISYDTPEHHRASREWQDWVPRAWRVGRGRTATLPVLLI